MFITSPRERDAKLEGITGSESDLCTASRLLPNYSPPEEEAVFDYRDTEGKSGRCGALFVLTVGKAETMNKQLTKH